MLTKSSMIDDLERALSAISSCYDPHDKMMEIDEVIENAIDYLRNCDSSNWISVDDRLPKQHKSIFAPWYGRREWTKAMWLEESDRMIVTMKFPDGTRTVSTGRLYDNKWRTDHVSRTLNPVVTHWMPFPELAEDENDGRNSAV